MIRLCRQNIKPKMAKSKHKAKTGRCEDKRYQCNQKEEKEEECLRVSRRHRVRVRVRVRNRHKDRMASPQGGARRYQVAPRQLAHGAMAETETSQRDYRGTTATVTNVAVTNALIRRRRGKLAKLSSCGTGCSNSSRERATLRDGECVWRIVGAWQQGHGWLLRVMPSGRAKCAVVRLQVAGTVCCRDWQRVARVGCITACCTGVGCHKRGRVVGAECASAYGAG